MGRFGASLWRNTIFRIITALATSFGFSALIASIWGGGVFLETLSAGFLMFHGGVSPAVLGASIDTEKPLMRYITAYVANLLIVILPATIFYRSIYGELMFGEYDYFSGIILYLTAGTLIIIIWLMGRRYVP